MKIQEYFDLKAKKPNQFPDPSSPIRELLNTEEARNNSEEAYNNCLKWLLGYEKWKDFVETYYFQDYVDKDWEVKPFCKGHSKEKGCNEIKDYEALTYIIRFETVEL